MLTRVLIAAALILLMPLAALAEETKVLALGLTDHAVTEAELGDGADLPQPHFNTPGVAYALIADLKKGDMVEVALTKDGKALMHNIREVEADAPRVLLQAGKTGVPAGGWLGGTYTAMVTVTRDGKPILEDQSEAIPFD
ncbi:MAG: hypothetical protein R3D01_08820 [Hyphomicrobiales bacterium]